MSKQATQDDDLIILSDSVTNDDEFNFDIESTKIEDTTDVIDFSLSEEPKVISEEKTLEVDEAKQDDFSIDFSFWDTTDTNQDSQIEDDVKDLEVENNNESSDDLWFNFVGDDMIDIEAKQENEEDIVEENLNQDDNADSGLDLWFDLSNQENTLDVSPMVEEQKETKDLDPKDNFSRNDILDDTISRLNQRKEVLNIIRDSKKNKLDDLNAQIKLLKEEVKNVEKEVWELNEEEEWILSDIDTINEMKEVKAKKAKKSK